jgi:Zn-dependent membrane protease YugP
MYLQDYLWFIVAIVACIVFSGIASSKVRNSFNKHNLTRCRSGLTGYDTVTRLMRAGGVRDIAVGSV